MYGSKNLSIIRQNLAFSVESTGQQLEKTLLTIVLNNCRVNLTFMVQ